MRKGVKNQSLALPWWLETNRYTGPIFGFYQHISISQNGQFYQPQ